MIISIIQACYLFVSYSFETKRIMRICELGDFDQIEDNDEIGKFDKI